ncbi:MAG: fibronectin type III domain-containing protein [Flavobacteriales bacterium]
MGQFTFNVRLGTTGITPTALVEKGRNNVTMLTGNAAFPTPTPTLAAITAAYDALDTANQAYDFNRGKAEKEARDAAFATAMEQMRELAGYVQAHCNNDKELIISSGFDVRRLSQPIGPLPAPANVRALVTSYPGRLELRWNGVRGRIIYGAEITDTDPLNAGGWAPLAQTSKNRYTVEGLKSNTVYSFRITTIGSDGASPVSDIATAKAA